MSVYSDKPYKLELDLDSAITWLKCLTVHDAFHDLYAGHKTGGKRAEDFDWKHAKTLLNGTFEAIGAMAPGMGIFAPFYGGGVVGGGNLRFRDLVREVASWEKIYMDDNYDNYVVKNGNVDKEFNVNKIEISELLKKLYDAKPDHPGEEDMDKEEEEEEDEDEEDDEDVDRLKPGQEDDEDEDRLKPGQEDDEDEDMSKPDEGSQREGAPRASKAVKRPRNEQPPRASKAVKRGLFSTPGEDDIVAPPPRPPLLKLSDRLLQEQAEKVAVVVYWKAMEEGATKAATKAAEQVKIKLHAYNEAKATFNEARLFGDKWEVAAAKPKMATKQFELDAANAAAAQAIADDAAHHAAGEVDEEADLWILIAAIFKYIRDKRQKNLLKTFNLNYSLENASIVFNAAENYGKLPELLQKFWIAGDNLDLRQCKVQIYSIYFDLNLCDGWSGPGWVAVGNQVFKPSDFDIEPKIDVLDNVVINTHSFKLKNSNNMGWDILRVMQTAGVDGVKQTYIYMYYTDVMALTVGKPFEKWSQLSSLGPPANPCISRREIFTFQKDAEDCINTYFNHRINGVEDVPFLTYVDQKMKDFMKRPLFSIFFLNNFLDARRGGESIFDAPQNLQFLTEILLNKESFINRAPYLIALLARDDARIEVAERAAEVAYKQAEELIARTDETVYKDKMADAKKAAAEAAANQAAEAVAQSAAEAAYNQALVDEQGKTAAVAAANQAKEAVAQSAAESEASFVAQSAAEAAYDQALADEQGKTAAVAAANQAAEAVAQSAAEGEEEKMARGAGLEKYKKTLEELQDILMAEAEKRAKTNAEAAYNQAEEGFAQADSDAKYELFVRQLEGEEAKAAAGAAYNQAAMGVALRIYDVQYDEALKGDDATAAARAKYEEALEGEEAKAAAGAAYDQAAKGVALRIGRDKYNEALKGDDATAAARAKYKEALEGEEADQAAAEEVAQAAARAKYEQALWSKRTDIIAEAAYEKWLRSPEDVDIFFVSVYKEIGTLVELLIHQTPMVNQLDEARRQAAAIEEGKMRLAEVKGEDEDDEGNVDMLEPGEKVRPRRHSLDDMLKPDEEREREGEALAIAEANLRKKVGRIPDESLLGKMGGVIVAWALEQPELKKIYRILEDVYDNDQNIIDHFNSIDNNNDGYIDQGEFIGSFGYDVQFSLYDLDGDGKINFDEFKTATLYRRFFLILVKMCAKHIRDISTTGAAGAMCPDPALSVMCNDGSCKAAIADCGTSGAMCPDPALSVMCNDGSCKMSADECPTPDGELQEKMVKNIQRELLKKARDQVRRGAPASSPEEQFSNSIYTELAVMVSDELAKKVPRSVVKDDELISKGGGGQSGGGGEYKKTSVATMTNGYALGSILATMLHCFKNAPVSGGGKLLQEVQNDILKKLLTRDASTGEYKKLHQGGGLGDMDTTLLTSVIVNSKWPQRETQYKGENADIIDKWTSSNPGVKMKLLDDIRNKANWRLASDNLKFVLNKGKKCYISNAVSAKSNFDFYDKFFCPLASIMDGQPTCSTSTYGKAVTKNGVEWGVTDIIITTPMVDVVGYAKKALFTYRFRVVPEGLDKTTNTPKYAHISVYLAMRTGVGGSKDITLINRYSAPKNFPLPKDGWPGTATAGGSLINGFMPYAWDNIHEGIKVDLTVPSTTQGHALAAQTTLENLIFLMDNLPRISGKTDNYKNLLDCLYNDDPEEELNIPDDWVPCSRFRHLFPQKQPNGSYAGFKVKHLRRAIIETSNVKSLGDLSQELDGIAKNGGYLKTKNVPKGVGGSKKTWDGPQYSTNEGTKIIQPVKGRVVFHYDRPSAARSLILTLYAKVDVNPNTMCGFVGNKGENIVYVVAKRGNFAAAAAAAGGGRGTRRKRPQARKTRRKAQKTKRKKTRIRKRQRKPTRGHKARNNKTKSFRK